MHTPPSKYVGIIIASEKVRIKAPNDSFMLARSRESMLHLELSASDSALDTSVNNKKLDAAIINCPDLRH